MFEKYLNTNILTCLIFYLNNSVSVYEATLQEAVIRWMPELSVLWVPELRAAYVLPMFCQFCLCHFTSKINFDLADFEFFTRAAAARRKK